MSESSFLSEEHLAGIERGRDPEMIPHLVSAIRQQQHDLDSLRLGLDVARRDREELRYALLAAQAEIRELRGGSEASGEAGADPSGRNPGGR